MSTRHLLEKRGGIIFGELTSAGVGNMQPPPAHAVVMGLCVTNAGVVMPALEYVKWVC